jgi:hypothetical protein
MTPESGALRAALERQAGVLAPIATHLQAATAHPPISPHDWHGPASEASRAREQLLRSRIVAAESAVTDALHGTRMAVVMLGA